VFIPFDNEPDLAEVDEAVKRNVKFIPVKNIGTILNAVLIKDIKYTENLTATPKNAAKVIHQ